MVADYELRKVGRWDSEDETQMVSTCTVSDGRKPFETAVMHPAYNNGKMIIVECYDTRKDAQLGHDKWLQLILNGKLPLTLVDCGNSMISQLIGGIGGGMAFERNVSVYNFLYEKD